MQFFVTNMSLEIQMCGQNIHMFIYHLPLKQRNKIIIHRKDDIRKEIRRERDENVIQALTV